jgi:hypothetical protein
MLLFEWAPRIETAGYKLAEGKGLREVWHSKELWKSVESQRTTFCGARKPARQAL